MRWRDRFSGRYAAGTAKAVKEVFGFWLLGLLVATYYGYAKREGASFVWIGAFLGAILWLLYSAGNKYRREAELTWPQFAGQAILLVLALLVVVRVSDWFNEDWNRVAAVLLLIGFGAAYTAGGLLVLYLAVRVVRAAWYRDHPPE